MLNTLNEIYSFSIEESPFTPQFGTRRKSYLYCVPKRCYIHKEKTRYT